MRVRPTLEHFCIQSVFVVFIPPAAKLALVAPNRQAVPGLPLTAALGVAGVAAT